MTGRWEQLPEPLKNAVRPYMRRRRSLRALSVFLDTFLAAGILACIAVFLFKTGVLRFQPALAVPILLGIPFFPSLAVFLFMKGGPSQVFLAVDRYYGLHECTVTSSQVTEGPFSSLLLRRSVEALKKGDPKKVFSSPLRRRHAGIPPAMVLLLLLRVVNISEMSPSARAGETLSTESRILAQRAEEDDLPYSREFARRMEELAEDLTADSMDRQEAIERIEELRRQILRAVDDLERSYLSDSGRGERPEGGDDGDAREYDTGEGSVSSRAVSSEWGDSGGEVPGSDPHDKSFGDADSGTDDATSGNEGYREERTGRNEDIEALQEAEEALSRARESLEEGDSSGGEGDDRTEQDSPAGDGSGDEESPQKGSSPGDDGPSREGGGQSSAPGNEKRKDIIGEMYQPMENDSTDGIPLEGHEDPGESPFGAFIRALPEYSFSELSARETDKEYTRLIEEAVTNENIPLRLRGVVRDYFLYLEREKESEEDL